MQRTPISSEALRALINDELAQLESCENVEVASIEVLRVPDTHGCNWRVASFVNGRPAEPCEWLASVAIWALQWRYNVEGDRA
jgi:hypothetical protein